MMTDTDTTTTIQMPAWTAGQEDCPGCTCCTAALCARGRVRLHRCVGSAPKRYKTITYNCPCSSAQTRGTHAWRAERHRVTVMATENPLPPAVEVALRALVQGAPAADLDLKSLALLRVAGFVAELSDEVFVVTDLGAYYLHARSDFRFPACVEVVSADRRTRTAQVIVGAWDPARPVTVLLDLLLLDTERTVDQLPGLWLEAETNCPADPDDVVLTRVRVAPELPADVMPLPVLGVAGGH